MKFSNHLNARDIFLNKLCFTKFFPLSSDSLIVFVVAQFTFVFLSFAAPGPELVSCAQPFETASTQGESESNSETTDRSIADADARVSRPRRAPSRSFNIFATAIPVPTQAFTALNTKSLLYFSRTALPPTHPSVFRNSPLII